MWCENLLRPLLWLLIRNIAYLYHMQFTSVKIDLVILRGNGIESLAPEGTWVVSEVRLSANITHRPHCKANSIFYGIFNKTTTYGAMKTKKSVYIIVFAGFKLPTPYILVLCHTTGNCGIWYICAYSRGPQGFERKSQPIPAAIAMSK